MRLEQGSWFGWLCFLGIFLLFFFVSLCIALATIIGSVLKPQGQVYSTNVFLVLIDLARDGRG